MTKCIQNAVFRDISRSPECVACALDACAESITYLVILSIVIFRRCGLNSFLVERNRMSPTRPSKVIAGYPRMRYHTRIQPVTRPATQVCAHPQHVHFTEHLFTPPPPPTPTPPPHPNPTPLRKCGRRIDKMTANTWLKSVAGSGFWNQYQK